jgi:NarL family two-component system response regulator LiaR
MSSIKHDDSDVRESDGVRVAIVEAHTIFARALATVLDDEAGIHVVGEMPAAIGAPFARMQPNIVLVDIDGQTADFGEMMAHLREVVPGARVVVLSHHAQAEVALRCLGAGAEGYVLKDISPAELARAIRSVAEGTAYVDPRMAGLLLRRTPYQSGRGPATDLSERETEIVRLIAGGLSNKEISAKLSLSEKTIKNHVSRIFAKLHITARTQAAVHAFKTGLV